MKFIGIAGSRNFKDKTLVIEVLNKIYSKFGEFIVVSGGADGPDKWAEEWAQQKGFSTKIFFTRLG